MLDETSCHFSLSRVIDLVSQGSVPVPVQKKRGSVPVPIPVKKKGSVPVRFKIFRDYCPSIGAFLTWIRSSLEHVTYSISKEEKDLDDPRSPGKTALIFLC